MASKSLIQPVVYKPTSPTKYLDAYTQTQLQRQDAQRKAQEKRRAERQKQMDQMGLYTDREYFSPVIQRYHDQYLKEFHDKSMARPQDMGRFINEFAAKTKVLDKDDSTVKDSYFEALDNREQYRDWDVFDDAIKMYDGGEELDLSSYSGLTAAARPFSKLEKTFDLGGFIEKQGNAYLKNLANDPVARAEYFDELPRTRPLGEMTINEMYTAVKRGKREEVMGQILSLNPNAMAQASYDVTGKSGYTPEDVQGIVSQTTQDQFYRLGTDVLRKMVKRDDSDGGGTDRRIQDIQVSTDDVGVDIEYDEAKRSEFMGYEAVKLPGVEEMVDGLVTIEQDGDMKKKGRVIELSVGQTGRNAGKPVAIVEVDFGRGRVQTEEVPFEDVKTELINQVEVSNRRRNDKDTIINRINDWEVRALEAKGIPFDDSKLYDVHDALYVVAENSDLTDKEKTAKYREILGTDNVKWSSSILKDIEINGRSFPLYGSRTREKKEPSLDFLRELWKLRDSFSLPDNKPIEPVEGVEQTTTILFRMDDGRVVAIPQEEVDEFIDDQPNAVRL